MVVNLTQPTAFAQLRLALEEHRANPDDPPTAPSTVPTTPTLDRDPHDLGLDVYVAPGETDGLPKADSAATVERRASRLVKAHQNGRFGGFLRRRKPKQEDPPKDGDVEKSATAPKAGPSVGGMMTGPGTGGGVLSSLLALYDHHNMRSGQSTPSRDLTDDEGENPFFKDHGERMGKRSQEGFGRHRRHHSAAASVPVPQQSHSDSNSTVTPNPSSHAPPSPSAGFTLSFPKALKPSARPAAARSAAGVFGGLIASTGNISGAAAPAASTLAPSAKRPGYHLSR